MPVFTHALLLREGHVTAQGAMTRVLTSANLSKTFAAKLRVLNRSNRYTLRVLGRHAGVM